MKNKITTSDVYFAAALLSLGAKLDGVDKTDPRHMQFTIIRHGYEFKSNDIPSGQDVSNMSDLEVYETQWANADMIVNATAFKDAIQRMKSVIHSSS